MTDKEIIKALGMCLDLSTECDGCAYETTRHCYQNLVRDALDLINRQQEKLKVQADNIHATLKMKDVEIQRTRAEAIKEFAEKLKEKVSLFSTIGTQEFADGAAEALEWYDKKVEETLNEMAGDRDE